ncbi:hypothetical protein C8Q77DRAFT_392051 [Trametes polyzona]|nr:hypothetical protein C8Q77DRAFT_392051 [Trametes polyzona]
MAGTITRYATHFRSESMDVSRMDGWDRTFGPRELHHYCKVQYEQRAPRCAQQNRKATDVLSSARVRTRIAACGVHVGTRGTAGDDWQKVCLSLGLSGAALDQWAVAGGLVSINGSHTSSIRNDVPKNAYGGSNAVRVRGRGRLGFEVSSVGSRASSSYWLSSSSSSFCRINGKVVGLQTPFFCRAMRETKTDVYSPSGLTEQNLEQAGASPGVTAQLWAYSHQGDEHQIKTHGYSERNLARKPPRSLPTHG